MSTGRYDRHLQRRMQMYTVDVVVDVDVDVEIEERMQVKEIGYK